MVESETRTNQNENEKNVKSVELEISPGQADKLFGKTHAENPITTKVTKGISNLASGVSTFSVVKMKHDIRNSATVVKKIVTLRKQSSVHTSERDAELTGIPQYHITSARKIGHQTRLQKIKSFLCCQRPIEKSWNYITAIGGRTLTCAGIFNLNVTFGRFLVFSYKASFTTLFCCLFFFYFTFIIIFSLIIWGVGEFKPECITPTFGESNTHFADAFALSWTTFTTVGYGNTYPSTSAGEVGFSVEKANVCALITTVCTLEAFMGILCTGICGAVIFNKVVWLRSLAPVRFSDPMTIRYGKGLVVEKGNSSLEDDLGSGRVPCPVLSFRIANLNFDEPGAEIMDAQLKTVVIVDGEIPLADVDKETEIRKYNSLLKADNDLIKSKLGASANLDVSMKSKSSDDSSVVVVEENSDFRHRFFSLSVDTPENPYFKRIWRVQHTLNENSPLVKPHVRKMIANNDGFWPTRLNNHLDLRDSLSFDHIFVSLSGTSMLSGTTVYSQHLYDFLDVNIGYQFVPILYKSRTGNVMINFKNLNDVVEQNGGGGEPFHVDVEEA